MTYRLIIDDGPARAKCFNYPGIPKTIVICFHDYIRQEQTSHYRHSMNCKCWER